MRSPHGSWLWCVAGLLALQASGLFCYGVWRAWARRSDADLQSRWVEYDLYRDGIYPNAHLEPHPPDRSAHTVYPPYAFPMTALFFEPYGLVQGRLLVEVLSLASYAAMALYAWRTLAPYGRPVAAVGAFAGAAIAGNGTALWLSQFSIVCTGLLVAQLWLLERGRPLMAGVCWALAMIKPQIGLPFFLLFVVSRQWRGGLLGVALLGGLSLVASQWTEVPLTEIVSHWTRGMSLRFTEESNNIGPGTVAKAFGIDPRAAQAVALAVLAAVAVPVVRRFHRLEGRQLLPVAGMCAVAGMFMSYHRHYDNVMLFPAVLAAMAFAASSARPAAVAVATATLALLLVHERILSHVPLSMVAQGVTWAAAGVLSLWLATPPRRSPGGDLFAAAPGLTPRK